MNGTFIKHRSSLNFSNMKIFIPRWIGTIIIFIAELAFYSPAIAQTPETLLIIRDPKTNLSQTITEAKPLDELIIVGAKGKQIQVSDGAGVNYFTSNVRDVIPFIVGGALGTHTVTRMGADGIKTVLFHFAVNATT